MLFFLHTNESKPPHYYYQNYNWDSSRAFDNTVLPHRPVLKGTNNGINIMRHNPLHLPSISYDPSNIWYNSYLQNQYFHRKIPKQQAAQQKSHYDGEIDAKYLLPLKHCHGITPTSHTEYIKALNPENILMLLQKSSGLYSRFRNPQNYFPYFPIVPISAIHYH